MGWLLVNVQPSQKASSRQLIPTWSGSVCTAIFIGSGHKDPVSSITGNCGRTQQDSPLALHVASSCSLALKFGDTVSHSFHPSSTFLVKFLDTFPQLLSKTLLLSRVSLCRPHTVCVHNQPCCSSYRIWRPLRLATESYYYCLLVSVSWYLLTW